MDPERQQTPVRACLRSSVRRVLVAPIRRQLSAIRRITIHIQSVIASSCRRMGASLQTLSATTIRSYLSRKSKALVLSLMPASLWWAQAARIESHWSTIVIMCSIHRPRVEGPLGIRKRAQLGSTSTNSLTLWNIMETVAHLLSRGELMRVLDPVQSNNSNITITMSYCPFLLET